MPKVADKRRQVDDRARRFPLGARLTIDALADDPYPTFRELRALEPVTWAPQLDMWLLTRRDDIVRVLADWKRFTTDSPASNIRDIFGSHMLTTDGEAQIRYKRRFIGPFRRGQLERNLLGTVESVLDEVMRELKRHTRDPEVSRSADLRARVARPLSWRSICRVLGLPEGDGVRLVGWYDRFAAALENFAGDPDVRAAGKEAAREFGDYVSPFLRGEEAVPEGSMIAVLREGGTDAYRPGGRAGGSGRSGGVSGRSGGVSDRGGDAGPGPSDPLTEAEMIANLLIVLFGGIETTESMIGNALWAVLSHPAIARTVVADPAKIEAVIEESMRWDPAVQSCTRFTTEPVEIRGVQIPANETVQCMLGAANRDPAHFPDPDRFDPGRANAGDHLAFGAGRHFCLGASLARIEAEQALVRVLGGLPGLRLDPSRPTRPHGHEFRTPPAVWVLWDQAAGASAAASRELADT